MKKQYEKPKILFESFSLSTSIAVCGVNNNNNPSRGICAYQPPRQDKFIFTLAVVGCTSTEQDDDYNNKVCYHVPTEYTQLFNS